MSLRLFALFAMLGVSLQGLALALMGQPLFFEGGYIKFWEGTASGPGNSQHLFDWYTFSHVAHGFIFYALLSYFFPKLSWPVRLSIALGAEIAWELLENTSLVIDQYRETALANGYYGDSILNSLSDTATMVVGFIAAWRLPVWVSVVLLVGMEAASLYAIRDGLALNIMNLVWPLQMVQQWQVGA